MTQARALDLLRGAVRLSVDGIHGVTRIAQGLHGNISTLAPPLGRAEERPSRGIAGFVYGAVRTGSSVAGHGLDTLLAGVQAMTSDEVDAAPNARRDAVVSALNGVVGDHLERTGNPLAIRMDCRVHGPARPKLLLLVHGLCMSDSQWMREGHDHGLALGEALGYTPVYVRYNSGRHVSANGAELASRLEELVAGWPVPLESFAVVGHSMGGLVARSAVHQAQQAGLSWTGHLRKIVFLGTPHHGAVLERAGNWLHTVLGISPYLAPFTRLARLRSDGITDLRHGNLLEGDWQAGRFAHRDTRTAVPLPPGIACYAIAGSLQNAAARGGDGLVSVDSALGRHARSSRALRFPASRTWVANGVNHLDLLGDAGVGAKLRTWLR
jgi:pimeloyl-ACP methyl ester carboxylesterase